MARFALLGKIPVKADQRDALVSVLLDAAEALRSVPECELYVVNVSPTEPDAVWVFEVWSSSEAHKAYLATDEFKAALSRGMPLIDGPVEGIELVPQGARGSRRAIPRPSVRRQLDEIAPSSEWSTRRATRS